LLVPFFMEHVAFDTALMQSDGNNPNAAGQPVLLDTIWPLIETVLAETINE
jgi:acyl-CoA thioesterase-1